MVTKKPAPTSVRQRRIARVIHRRQPDVTVFLDQIHNPHNISAILRTADAVGVGEVVWCFDHDEGDQAPPLNPEVAQGSEKWVKCRRVPNLADALKAAKDAGRTVVATHLAANAVPHTAVDWTKPVAVVMGNEHAGCSAAVLELADINVAIPMFGFVQSLNVSVATAVLLFEIQRQRQAAGMYDRVADPAYVEHLFAEWDLILAGYRLDDFLAPPDGPPEPLTPHHHNGRYGPQRTRGSRKKA